ncbi:hypothetical protein [Kiloniella majae]|uniref:hypothetical protein n=1 Tax=Kiloniella majae TaxID=1938558 RepID=UPI000A278D90|nr:hypothetical protein [Kiloniella majae]
MKKIKLVSSAFLMATMLSGCEYLRAASFQKANDTGISKGQFSSLVYMNKSQHVSDAFNDKEEYNQLVEWDLELDKAINVCLTPPPIPPIPLPSDVMPLNSLTVVAAPFIAAGVQLAFGFAVDELSSRVIELKKRGSKTYAKNIVVPGSVLDVSNSTALNKEVELNANQSNDVIIECLLLHRKTMVPVEDKNGKKIKDEKGKIKLEPKIKMATVVQVLKRGNGAVFRTSYLRLDNGVALTSKPKKGGSPALAVSSAISSKGLRKNTKNQGVDKVLLAAESLGTVLVKVGSEKSVFANCGYTRDEEKDLRECGPESDIVAPSDGTLLGSSYTVAITEKGSIGFDADRAKAELDTVKAAIGPVIGEYVNNRLNPPE